MDDDDNALIFAGIDAILGENNKGLTSEKVDNKGDYSIPLDSDCLFQLLYQNIPPQLTANKYTWVLPDTNDAKAKFFGRHCVYTGVGVSFTGKTFTFLYDSDRSIKAVKEIFQDQTGLPIDQLKIFWAGEPLEDHMTISECNIPRNGCVIIYHELRGGGCAVYHLQKHFFDPQFNYDFTKIKDTNKSFVRGGAQYYRPVGCKRYAIKVDGKYPDAKWLGYTGEAGEEWPVAYHGTRESSCSEIIGSGFDLNKCKRFAFGHGIYCTPDPMTAKKYAKEYVFQGETYHLIFQVRVNPKTIVVVKEATKNPKLGEYWLVPGGGDIRPYGICVYPVKKSFFDFLKK